MGTTFRTEVVKGLRNSDWNGEAADAAFEKFDDVDEQIKNAALEASAVYDLLSSALECFQSAKRELDDIDKELQGHEHLSLNRQDGSVHVDAEKVEDEHYAQLCKAYTGIIEAYRRRTKSALVSARDGDQALKWALSQDGATGRKFNADAYRSIESAQADRQKAEKVRVNPSSAGPFGSSTIKPTAEFLSYRPWINAGSSLVRGNFSDAWSYFLDGTPAYAAGKASESVEKYPGGGGRHRKPSFTNRVGSFGTKVFGWPVALGATIVDYAYTPESDPTLKEKKSRTVAPGPLNGKVR